MPAKSKKQQALFGLARAVQKGDVPPNKVTSNVRQIARNTSPTDVEKMASTSTKKLPTRVDTKHASPPPDEENETFSPNPSSTPAQRPITFGDVVETYNSLKDTIMNPNKFREIGDQLEAIAEYAEQTITNEMADDWYDAHTVQRNIKEMKKYVRDFKKIASTVDEQNQRMGAYYEDMGRIIDRYFQIYDENASNVNIDYTRPNATTEPPLDRDGRPITDTYDARAVREVKTRFRGSEKVLAKFNSLPLTEQVKVAWKLI